ncbi:MAG TPA: hypothetical protein EYQ50_05540 [Verrucomicrobiales bacterium]|nr:hypothetical protein [Verrucomicrobiales bacterium]
MAAVFLGLALLAKETAAFYVIAVLMLWTVKADGKRNLRDLAVLTMIPALLSGWWYLVVNAQSIIRNLNFAAEKTEHWQQSSGYYFQNLEREMGTVGCALALIGISAVFYHLSKPRPPGTIAVKSQFTNRACLWPVALLLPNYGLLSLLENKVAWIVIILLPAWATLQGYAMDKMLAYYQSVLMNWIRADVSSFRKTLRTTIPATLCVTLVLTVSGPLFSQDYESFLKSTDQGQWRGASMSREAAEAMNRHLKPNERVLITSFHYWQSLAPDHACAVFTYYFEQPVKVLMRPSATAFTDLVEDIKKYEIDWALLSPPLGPMETEVFGGFIEELDLSPIRLEGAFLFKTDTIRSTPD